MVKIYKRKNIIKLNNAGFNKFNFKTISFFNSIIDSRVFSYKIYYDLSNTNKYNLDVFKNCMSKISVEVKSSATFLKRFCPLLEFKTKHKVGYFASNSAAEINFFISLIASKLPNVKSLNKWGVWKFNYSHFNNNIKPTLNYISISTNSNINKFMLKFLKFKIIKFIKMSVSLFNLFTYMQKFIFNIIFFYMIYRI